MKLENPIFTPFHFSPQGYVFRLRWRSSKNSLETLPYILYSQMNF